MLLLFSDFAAATSTTGVAVNVVSTFAPFVAFLLLLRMRLLLLTATFVYVAATVVVAIAFVAAAAKVATIFLFAADIGDVLAAGSDPQPCAGYAH